MSICRYDKIELRGMHLIDQEQPCKQSLLWFQEEMFCHEFHLVDLRVYENCKKVMTGCEHVFNLAADMGGMGFIQSNHSVIMYNNTMISFNMLEAARVLDIKRYDTGCFTSTLVKDCQGQTKY